MAQLTYILTNHLETNLTVHKRGLVRLKPGHI